MTPWSENASCRTKNMLCIHDYCFVVDLAVSTEQFVSMMSLDQIDDQCSGGHVVRVHVIRTELGGECHGDESVFSFPSRDCQYIQIRGHNSEKTEHIVWF